MSQLDSSTEDTSLGDDIFNYFVELRSEESPQAAENRECVDYPAIAESLLTILIRHRVNLLDAQQIARELCNADIDFMDRHLAGELEELIFSHVG